MLNKISVCKYVCLIRALYDGKNNGNNGKFFLFVISILSVIKEKWNISVVIHIQTFTFPLSETLFQIFFWKIRYPWTPIARNETQSKKDKRLKKISQLCPNPKVPPPFFFTHAHTHIRKINLARWFRILNLYKKSLYFLKNLYFKAFGNLKKRAHFLH